MTLVTRPIHKGSALPVLEDGRRLRPLPSLLVDRPVIRLRDGFPGQNVDLRPDIRRFQRLMIAAGERSVTADGWFGTQSQAAARRLQERWGFFVDGVVRPALWRWLEHLQDHPDQEQDAPGITLDQLLAIVGPAREQHVRRHINGLNEAMTRYEVTTPLRRAHFLAQIAHESGGLRWPEELASGEAYEGRTDLGNTQPGDGRRYKGRGLIQLTGRHNYQRYAATLRSRGDTIDVEEDPHRVSQDPYAADVAGWFWDLRGLNRLADADDLEAVTRRVNGGTRGIEERERYLDLAKRVLRA
jgi:putative chitinase